MSMDLTAYLELPVGASDTQVVPRQSQASQSAQDFLVLWKSKYLM